MNVLETRSAHAVGRRSENAKMGEKTREREGEKRGGRGGDEVMEHTGVWW